MVSGDFRLQNIELRPKASVGGLINLSRCDQENRSDLATNFNSQRGTPSA